MLHCGIAAGAPRGPGPLSSARVRRRDPAASGRPGRNRPASRGTRSRRRRSQRRSVPCTRGPAYDTPSPAPWPGRPARWSAPTSPTGPGWPGRAASASPDIRGTRPPHGRGRTPRARPAAGARAPAASRPRPDGTTPRGAAPGHDPRRQTMRAFHSPGTTIRAAVLAASLATTGAASALAEEPDQGAAVVTPLGAGSSALTYWTDVPEGFRVVTTVDTVQPGGAARHAVFRSSIVLRPGQTQTISLPGPPGSASPGLEVRRLGDRVEVRAAGPAALAD